VPADLPAAPLYELHVANLSATGADLAKVIHRRQLVREAASHRVDVGWGGDVQDAVRVWLVALGGARTATACARKSELTLRSVDESALRGEIAPVQRTVERDFTAMVAELHGLRVLTRDEARGARPAIRVELVDYRGDQSQPLPEPAALLTPRPLRRLGR
jgi:hypothetical protein